MLEFGIVFYSYLPLLLLLGILKEGNKMKKYIAELFSGERALFMSHDIIIEDSIFLDGESPLKESSNVELNNSSFQWKYPLWYCSDVKLNNCSWFKMARAGVWYSNNISINKALIEAPKNFRRCKNLKMEDVTFTDAEETLWSCCNVEMKNVSAKGDYFFMNSSSLLVDNLSLSGNYSFDGVKDVVVKNSKLLSKDAFWNSENVRVEDSYISGEYLGWNSKNLTLVNCTIESLQGLCYIENLKLINCKLINTTLSFEYSKVDAEIKGTIDSVFNPEEGRIKADEVKLYIDENNNQNVIIDADIKEKVDRAPWRKQ